MDTVWLFGPIAVLVSSVLVVLGMPFELAFYIAALLGMPTWFCGALFLGIKSDELLGVEGAFAYETIGMHDTPDSDKE